MEVETHAAPQVSEDPDVKPAAQAPWAVLILLSVAQFMVIIDATVVNVALPSIGKGLGFATAADLQWVVTAYVLVTGGLTLLGGRLTDFLGRRSLFLAGLFVFTGASLATGLAPSPELMVASRVIQGVGAALLTPAALSIIATLFVGPRRTTAFAVWGALGAGGSAIGVVLGGVLTSWLGWQWVFFINVPIGIAAAAVGLFLLPPMRGTDGELRNLDLGGALLLIAGLATLVFSITSAASHGWRSAQTLLPFVTAAGLLAAVALVERRSRNPIVPPSTWRVRSLVTGNAVFFGASAVMGGVFFLSSLYLQRVLGLSAWEAGLAFLPLALAVGAGAQVASRLVSHAGVRAVLLAGLVIEAGGALLLAQVSTHSTYPANVLPGFLAIGIGLGFSFAGAPLVVMADVRSEDSGLASGLMQTAHEIGISLGVASLSAITTSVAISAGLVVGYRQSMLVAAGIAGVLAVFSLAVVPAVRPAGATRPHMHGG
jgi:EmrB/QacA subfamily drug resistance transporter